MIDSPFFKYGARLALANRGVSQTALRRHSGQAEQIDSPAGDVFQREVCKIAAAVYAADGLAHSVPGQLFTKLAGSDQWCAAYNRFSEPVLVALGRYAQREEGLSKRAAAAAAIPYAADKAGVPSVVKLLLGLGAVGGVGAGSLGFLLSRHARQSSAENNELTEKTRAYKQLRRDIDEDLAASGALEESAPKSSPRYAL